MTALSSLWALWLVVAIPVEAVPNPRPAGSWVSDVANLIPPATESRIDGRLEALERDLGVEIAVVTVSGIERHAQGVRHRLFAHWGIGKAGADNGLLVLMVADQRRIEMETGYGLEPILPDGWLSAMQHEVMLPAFRSGDHGAGLEAGLARIDERLRAQAREAHAGAPGGGAAAAVARAARRRAQPRCSVAAPPGSGLLAGVPLLVRAARRRERTCRNCKIQMRLLDEVQDDAHLDAGQRTEETIGSVDYRVYICRQCQGSRTVARRRWFSGYSRCPGCHYRAVQVDLRDADPRHLRPRRPGAGDRDLPPLPHRRSYLRTTARLTRSSSSSSARPRSSSLPQRRLLRRRPLRRRRRRLELVVDRLPGGERRASLAISPRLTAGKYSLAEGKSGAGAWTSPTRFPTLREGSWIEVPANPRSAEEIEECD